MRLFVALSPPPGAREHLDAFLEPRRDAGDLRWVDVPALHLTLAFLGEVPERRLDELTESLAAAASDRTAVRLRLAGGGAFPDVAAARVLWVGVEPVDPADPGGSDDPGALAGWARAMRTAATRVGVPVDGARFRPHVTVARLARGGGDATRWLRVLDAYAGPAWVGDTVTVVRSHLAAGPGGRSRYEVLAELGPA